MGEEDVDPLDFPIRARGRRTPDRLALVDAETDDRWTYAEFDAAIERVRTALDEAGVPPGGSVATVFDSRPITVALLFAARRHGATLAPLNVELDRTTLADQLDWLQPDLVLCGDDTAAMATELAQSSLETVDPDSSLSVERFGVSMDSGGEGSTADLQNSDPSRPVLVAFTSGTTGRPKGVRLTWENLRASAVASAGRLGVTPRDRWLSPLSTYHVGGLAPYVRTALSGTTAVLQRSFDAEATASVCEERAITCVSLVPTMLSRLLDAGWHPNPDLRFVLFGGGPAQSSLLERAFERDVPVCPTYGTTETASQVATATPGEAIAHPGTVGRPIRGATVRIVDGDGSVPAGETGDVLVEGPMVSPGYLDPAATERAVDDGVLRTGDRGYRDEDGRLWIVGRSDEVIVTGGENVQPSVVETALCSHPAVTAAAVVGVADAEWGERVVALVVADDEDVTPAELRDRCRDELPTFAVPKIIVLADSLPRTPSGTVDRAAVRSRFS